MIRDRPVAVRVAKQAVADFVVTLSYRRAICVRTMSRNLPPFAALRAFDAVGRLSGIRRAAAALGVSHAIVSRHLRALEQDLGQSLFDRDSSQLTVIGEAYHRRISAAIAELESASIAARSKRKESLVVWCAPGLAHQWLTAHLARYTSQTRTSVLDLRASDSPPDLINNQADGDIRYLGDLRGIVDRRIRHVELARPDVVPVASAEFANKFAVSLRNPADLLTAPLIHEGDDDQWRRWFACQRIEVPVLPRIAQYGHAHLALAAAKAGQGVALGNSYLCADDIAAGRLFVLSPTEVPFQPAPLGAYVFRALSAMWTDPAIARFRKWLVAEFKKEAAY